MEFARILREMRKERGLTQRELSNKTGLSPQCISAFESGVNNPTGSSLVLLAEFFNVSVDYLLGRSDELGAVNMPHYPDDVQTRTIDQSEEELLRLFRKLPPEYQNLAITNFRIWAGEPASSESKRKA